MRNLFTQTRTVPLFKGARFSRVRQQPDEYIVDFDGVTLLTDSSDNLLIDRLR